MHTARASRLPIAKDWARNLTSHHEQRREPSQFDTRAGRPSRKNYSGSDPAVVQRPLQAADELIHASGERRFLLARPEQLVGRLQRTLDDGGVRP